MNEQTTNANSFALIARDIFRKDRYSNKTTKSLHAEICSALIGTLYVVCSEIWNLIEPKNDATMKDAHPKHLLWTLFFLKCYCTEEISTRVVGGVSNETFWKWTWLFVKAIAGLRGEIVSFMVD